MVKIKVFKKRYYLDSYFFVVCENDEEFFGFDNIIRDDDEKLIKWNSYFKQSMYNEFDELWIGGIPEHVKEILYKHISDPFFEIDMLKKFSKYNVRLLE